MLHIFAEKKNCKNMEITGKKDFLLEKLVSHIKNNLCDYVYVNRQRQTKTFFMKAFIQEHTLLPGCVFGPFTYVCCENCTNAFLLSHS